LAEEPLLEDEFLELCPLAHPLLAVRVVGPLFGGNEAVERHRHAEEHLAHALLPAFLRREPAARGPDSYLTLKKTLRRRPRAARASACRLRSRGSARRLRRAAPLSGRPRASSPRSRSRARRRSP